MTIAQKFTALFRNASGALIPGSVDDVGRVQAAIGPFATPDTAFNAIDRPGTNSAASVVIAGVANTRHVVTSVSASMAQVTNNSSQWRVTLTDSSLGIIWGAEFALLANQSQYAGFAGGFLFGDTGADLTLEFAAVSGPASSFNQTLVIGGYSVPV